MDMILASILVDAKPIAPTELLSIAIDKALKHYLLRKTLEPGWSFRITLTLLVVIKFEKILVHANCAQHIRFCFFLFTNRNIASNGSHITNYILAARIFDSKSANCSSFSR